MLYIRNSISLLMMHIRLHDIYFQLVHEFFIVSFISDRGCFCIRNPSEVIEVHGGLENKHQQPDLNRGKSQGSLRDKDKEEDALCHRHCLDVRPN